jgi:transcriptional regulator with PAS, ATPase and Fis domain
LVSGVERFVTKLRRGADEYKKGILEDDGNSTPGESALRRVTITSYERIAKSAEETEISVTDTYDEAESIGRKTAEVLLEGNENTAVLFKRITKIRVFCVNTVYSIEMTEDERRRIIVITDNFLDGVLAGVVNGLDTNSSIKNDGNNLYVDIDETPARTYLEFFHNIEVPVVIVDRFSLVRKMNKAAESFFDIDPRNAIQRRYDDVLGLKIGDLIGKSPGYTKGSVSYRTRMEVRGTDAIVDVQTILIDEEPDYVALVFFDLTECEDLKMRLRSMYSRV